MHTEHIVPPGVSESPWTLREYFRYAPLTFNGTSLDPPVVEKWVTMVYRAVRSIHCSDHLKVHYGTHSLVDDALYLLEGLSHSLSSTLVVTW